jgi:hypothetical protein
MQRVIESRLCVKPRSFSLTHITRVETRVQMKINNSQKNELFIEKARRGITRPTSIHTHITDHFLNSVATP